MEGGFQHFIIRQVLREILHLFLEQVMAQLILLNEAILCLLLLRYPRST